MTRWRWAALAGGLAVCGWLGFAGLESDAGCRALTAQPWSSLQASGGVARAAQLMAACGPTLRASMLWDALAFIPAFTAFLAAVLWALRPVRWTAIPGGVLIAGGAIVDQLEGLRLRAMLDAGATAEAVAEAASLTMLKIVLLSLATVVLGALIARAGGWRMIAGGVAVVGALSSALGAGNGGIGLAWLILVAVAITDAVRGHD